MGFRKLEIENWKLYITQIKKLYQNIVHRTL